MGESYEFEDEPAQPITQPTDPAWVAPKHKFLEVHTILTIIYIVLAVAVWTADDARFVDARMPILLFGIGAVAPYWFGKSSNG